MSVIVFCVFLHVDYFRYIENYTLLCNEHKRLLVSIIKSKNMRINGLLLGICDLKPTSAS